MEKDKLIEKMKNLIDAYANEIHILLLNIDNLKRIEIDKQNILIRQRIIKKIDELELLKELENNNNYDTQISVLKEILEEEN